MHRIGCCLLVGVILGTCSPAEQGSASERAAGRRSQPGRHAAKLYEVRPRLHEPDAQMLLKPFPTYLTRSQFKTADEYGKYVRATLTIGMRVRALVDYERVKKGMRGTYFGTNDGTPPCLVMWDDDLKSSSVLIDLFPRSKSAHAYWIFWYQVDLNLD